MNLIKISLLSLLALFCFSSALTAQNAQPKKKQKQKQEIIVPESVMSPYLNEERVALRMKLFTDWLDSAEKVLDEYPPQKWKNNFPEVQPILPGAAIIRLNGVKDLALDPELEEASKCYRQYYKDVYNAALPLYDISKTMENFVEDPGYQMEIGVDANKIPVFKPAWPVYQAKFRRTIEATREVIKRGPQKMPAAEWKKVVKENRAERAKKYIEEMEKAIADGKMTLAEVNAKAHAKPSPAPAAKPAKQDKQQDKDKKKNKTKKDKGKETGKTK